MITVAVAVLTAAPVCAATLTSVNADEAAQTEQTQTKPGQTGQDSTQKPNQTGQENQVPTGGSDATEKSPNAKPDAFKSKKTKTFKVAIVKRNYGIYQGNFESKKPSARYFHKSFNVNRTFSHNGKKYYWINKKGKKAIGYINKKAVATPSQSIVIEKTPYVSQYVPVKAPWGCAGASMAMLLGSQGQKITTKFLQTVQNNLPMQPTKGGQKGNVYTGVGFGYVISPGALAKYARTFKKGKKVINISSKKLSLNDIKLYVQGGSPVLFYGYSSYQKAGDYHRNHCKVITGYKKGKFLVYDPLYYSQFAGAGSGGKNMKYDHGAVAWVSKSSIHGEFDHKAITIK